MKIIIKQSLVALTIFCTTVACYNQKSTLQNNLPPEIGLDRKTEPARDLALSNTLIDIDTTGLRQGRTLSDDELRKAKAAVYRFYSHLKLVDGIFKTDIQNANSINLSPQLFNLFLNDINKTNTYLLKMREEGKIVGVRQMSRATLDSLLK